MYRTKKDIDRHCQEIFRTIKSERERNFRCLSIAQQYYNVREYESAKRYVTLYLSTKDDSCAGHKLLAQCYEYFDEKEKALNEYKYALQLDPMQPELILRVCELLLENSVTVDISQIKYWLEKGEARFPYHPNIFKLRQKLVALGDRVDKNTTESIIMDQLKAKPDDPSVNCKYLNFLIESGRVKEAYMVAFAKPLTFVPTLQWYQSGAQCCKLYKTQFPVNEEFFANYLLVLERTLAFSVQDVKMFRKCITECVMFLAKFDELLSNVTALGDKSENLLVLVNHMAGQFCYHTAIILHRKVKDENDERDVRKFIAPLLLLSTSESFIISTYRKQSTVVDRVLNQCVQHNTYRISQAGFVLLSQCKGSSRRSYLEKIFQFCVANWRERILEKVYKGTPDCRSLCRSSFFLSYAPFASIPVDLPNGLVDNVEQFVSATETTQPFSLHHLVWLGVQYLINSEKHLISDRVLPLKFRSMAFESLRYAPIHSSTPSYAETLSKVDVDAFLYACVYCAESALSHAKKSSTVEAVVLPADVSKQLCSPEQELWWESAYHMAKKEIPESSFNRVRSALQNGIELIRLVGQTDLPLPLVVLLGRTFVNKAAIEPSEDLASALEGRALLYWRAALPRLERIIRNEVGHDSGKSMLDFSGPPISKPDALILLNEGKRFLDMQALKRNNYADLIVSDTISDYSEYQKPVQTPAGSSQQSNVVEEENFSTLFDQNMKIMDRLEALTKKQELLSTNQQELHEMVSVLAKKIDVFVLDTLTQAAHPPAQPPAVPITMGSASQPEVPNFSSLGVSSSSSSLGAPLQYPYPSGSIQTNFPMFSPSMPPIGYGMPSIASYRPPAPPPPLSFTPPSQPLPPPKFNLFSGMSPASLTLTNHAAAAEPSVPASAATNSSLSIGSPLSSSYNQGYSPLPSEVFANLTKAASLNSTPMTNTSNASLSHSFQIKLPEFGSFVKSPPVSTPEKKVGSDDDRRAVEHDPLPDFKPIIPLPDEITVTTGEENEEKLFETRAKLYRFADKEWKERGIGMFKVLKNRDTGRVRILMRREVVHKICANHFLTADMKLTPMMNSDRAWVYCAPDFSSEEMIVEKLCVKFKSPEIAEEFEQIFDQYKMVASAASSSMVERSVDDRSESSTSDDQSRPSTPDSSPVVQRTSSATRKIFFKPPSLNVDEITKEETHLAPKLGAFSFKSPAASTTTAEVTNESKSKFGGFTFSSTPIVTSSSDQEKPKTDDKPKSSPFTSFSFSSAGNLFKSAQAAPAGGSLFSTMTLDASKATTNSSKDSFMSFAPSSNAATDLSRTRDVDSTATEVPLSDPSAPFASVRDTIDFSSLIKGSGGANAFAKSENFKGFAGAGSRVFTSSSEKPASSFPTLTAILKNIDSASASPMSAAGSEANDSSVGERTSAEEEFVPTAEFAPVVALPDLVEVKTGEEGLKVMYEEHCKLFRFVDKEWKERGIGKMKILLDPKNGNMRMLMRRDQVHKVCCNQRLTADIELSPMKTNNKAWTWSNQDYSEGELKNELFCIRFKTQELAEAFQQVFKNCQKSLSNVTQSPITNPSNATEAQPLPSLAEQFKRDPNTWDCDVCYVRNPKEESYCTACTTPRQGVTTETPSASSGAFTSNMGSLFGGTSSKSEFTFGMPTATVTATAAAAAATTTTTTTTSATASVFSFGSGGDSSKATATTAPPMVFNFGPTATADTSSATAAVNPSLFSGFGSGALSPARISFEGTDMSKRVSGGSLFGSSATTYETAPADSKPKDTISVFSGNVIKPAEPSSTFSSFSFKLNDNPSFGFSSRSVVDGPSSQCTYLRRQDQVPFLVRDENDKLLFKSSAKLFRFASGDWEERATGWVQILLNVPLKKCRLLMLREPAGVVVSLNHYLPNGVTFASYDRRSWIWSASDFSEGEIVDEKFRLVFENDADANAFKSTLEDIDSENASVKSSSTDEVEFVSETRTSEEDKKLAESLQLPSNYFAYKYSDKCCAGCAGCEEEEEENLQDEVTDQKSTEETSQISKSTEPTHDTTNKPGIPSGFVFGASANSSWMSTPSFNFGNAFANSSKDSSSPQASASETAVENDGNEEEEVANNEIEPHFEPIVPLPDIIDVKTGEEDEEILFKERVKLFRYDEDKKEWKERGIGDMKLLRHRDGNSYRLLLRREMVHKVVLNQRLGPSLTLQPLSTNKNSLCWFGMNFSEESGTYELEKLAVRFKTEESMVKFEKAIADCVSKLQDTEQEHEYDGGADADENNPAAVEEYVDQQDYVDEQGIQDAMQDVDYADADDGNGTIFKTAAMLQFVEDDVTVDYTGVIKIFLAYYSGSDELNVFVDFSTADIPSLYATGVTKETDIILENGTVTFPDVSETAYNSKAVFRFENEELAERFYDTLIENVAETDETEFCEDPAA